ncbi:hypothetical protein AAG570_005290 [Ranatra chinensis]|uniref:NADH dehydrogenase [ubiquinone] 1 beta subcomplex subunit 7 n=1 Tax=Ranatra chinensis TaxID=642074 RepID=A0ABD0Y1L0_9HEMI
MGNISTGIDYKLHQDARPNPRQESKFDPLFGFTEDRKKKVMLASEEELYSAKIPAENRDYCAHLLLDYQKCRRNHWPMVYKCHDEKHAYSHCEYEDFVDRMKAYEREKRLMARQRRIEARGG